MRKNKNVVSAKFWRGASNISCIEVFLDGTPTRDIWAGNIEHCAKSLSEIELEEVIGILSHDKEDMLEDRNFPLVYEEMLSDLIKVQRERYGDKKRDKIATYWRCMDLPDVEKVFEQNFDIKDVHIDSTDISRNPDRRGWTYLTLGIRFRDGRRR